MTVYNDLGDREAVRVLDVRVGSEGHKLLPHHLVSRTPEANKIETLNTFDLTRNFNSNFLQLCRPLLNRIYSGPAQPSPPPVPFPLQPWKNTIRTKTIQRIWRMQLCREPCTIVRVRSLVG